MIRKRYTFTGRVQHVGFRWRAMRAAEMFGCTGWCRNNPNGSVTMELQGGRLKLALVVLALRAGRRIRIERMAASLVETVPGEEGFVPEYRE